LIQRIIYAYNEQINRMELSKYIYNPLYQMMLSQILLDPNSKGMCTCASAATAYAIEIYNYCIVCKK